MQTKVWLVLEHTIIRETKIRAIFSAEEKAKAYCKETPGFCYIECWQVDGTEDKNYDTTY